MKHACLFRSGSIRGITALTVSMLVQMLETEAALQAQDYSKGFEMLVKLGLPDTKGWKYVKSGSGNFRYDSLSRLLDGWEPSGDTWEEASEDADGIKRSTNDGITLTAEMKAETQEDYVKVYQLLSSKGIRPGNFYGRGGAGVDGNEAADADALIDRISTALGDERRRRSIINNSEILSGLFFRAAHWHRRGMPDQAGRLVGILMESLPRKSALLEVAIARIANERLGVASMRFAGTGDWKLLQADLESILKDFPRFWPERPLAERLLTEVTVRLSGELPPVAANGGFPLTPEQVAWWSKLTDSRTTQWSEGISDASRAGQLWASLQLPLTDETILEQGWNKEALGKGIFEVNNGWDWISVMGAGLGDKTLTAGGMEGYQNYSSSYGNDPESGPVELADEELEERWREMNRPKSRDEIARLFLKNVVPENEEREYDWWETADSVEIAEEAQAWREKLAGKVGEEMIKLYLDEGSESQKQLAAHLMAKTGSEEDLARLEEMVLLSPQEGISLALEIVKRRKAEGGAFLATFKTKLKEEMLKRNEGRGQVDPEEIEKQFDEYFGTHLKQMDTIVSGKGFSEMLAGFVDGTSDTQAFNSEVQTLGNASWTKEDAEAAFDAVLQSGEMSSMRRSVLLNVATTISWFLVNPELAATGRPAGVQGNTELNDAEMPEWMLDILRKVVEQGGGMKVQAGMGGEVPLTRMILYNSDLMVNNAAMQEVASALEGLPDEDMWAHFETRGRARLFGEPMPELPSGESVSEERRKEIEAGVSKIATGGWREFLTSLSVPEKLVLRDVIAAAKPDPAWRAAALTVAEVDVPEAAGASGAEWEALKDATLNADLVRKIMSMCEARASRPAVFGLITRVPLFGGLRLSVSGFEDGALDENRWISQIFNRRSRGNDEEEKAEFTAVAFVSWRDIGGGKALIRLLGKDGQWKTHTGDEAPGGYYLPFGEGIAEAGLEKELESWTSKAIPANSSFLFQFGILDVRKKNEE